MKKILIKNSQKQRLFEGIEDIDDNDISFSPEDLDYFGVDFSQHPGYINDDEDDSEDEEDFLSKTLDLLENGARAFDNLKNYYLQHPYAIKHIDALQIKLNKIEDIITKIEELFR